MARRSRYRLRAVRLVRGEEGHFHPNDVKFALLVVSANAFKGRAGRHVMVICENSLCLIRPSQLSLLEEPFDLLLKEVTEPEWNLVIELFDKTCLFLSACVIYRRYNGRTMDQHTSDAYCNFGSDIPATCVTWIGRCCVDVCCERSHSSEQRPVSICRRKTGRGGKAASFRRGTFPCQGDARNRSLYSRTSDDVRADVRVIRAQLSRERA